MPKRSMPDRFFFGSPAPSILLPGASLLRNKPRRALIAQLKAVTNERV